MKKYLKLFVFSTAVLLTIMFISPSLFAQGLKTLTWTGCGITKKAFMAEAAKAYEEETGGRINIVMSGGGATKGIRFADSGQADMGGNCRPALPDKFIEKESNARMTLVAWDALVPITNPNNPVISLTTDQLKDIMLGKITHWWMVGGPEERIQVVVRKGKTSGVGFMARLIIFNDQEADYAVDAVVHKSSGPVEKHIEKNKWAIGITGISSAKRRNVKILMVRGIDASVENIASGAYPTFRPLYITTRGRPAGEVKKFLDWLTSPKGQKVVESVGTVSLKQGRGLVDKFKYWRHRHLIVNLNLL